MEGKGLLFKIYAGIDVFDIEVDEKDPEEVHCGSGKQSTPTFGGYQPGRTSKRPNVLKSNVA